MFGKGKTAKQIRTRNESRYEGKTAYETKPNMKRKWHVKQTQYEGKITYETKLNMKERWHKK